jgi:hypothetical protein
MQPSALCDIHAQSVAVRNRLKRYPGDARFAAVTLLSPESKRQNRPCHVRDKSAAHKET